MADTKTASLTVLGGPLAGTQCLLPQEGTLTIGSSPDSSLYLDLPSVSPFHARVVAEAGSVVVHDTGSSRPVHVNDNPIGAEGTELRNGDILWLGSPGDDDVVMLQCILPRRSAAAAAVAPAFASEAARPAQHTPPPVPTPEIETTALWAQETVADAPSAVADEAEESVGDALESAMADAAAAAEYDERRQAGLGDDQGYAAAESASAEAELEPVAVVPDDDATLAAEASWEEPPAVAEPAFIDDEAPVVEPDAELAEPAPTLLMGGADEVAEAVDPGYRETVSLDRAPTFTEETFAPEDFTSETFDETPVAEAAAPTLVEPTLAEPEPAAAPPAAPPVPPAAPSARPADPMARPAAWQVATPAPSSSSPRVGPSSSQRIAPSASQRTRPAPRSRPKTAPRGGEPGSEDLGAPAGAGSSRGPMLLAVGGFVGVLALAGAGYFAWRSFAARPAEPVVQPTPEALATTPPPPPVAAAPSPETFAEPTPEPPTPEPIVAATPTPAPVAVAQAVPTPTPTPRATPTPRPTPTPRVTPTPAATPAAQAGAGPSPDQQRAQQAAAQVQALLGQAEAAAGSRQYDAALSHLDGVLRLEPGHARATSLRSEVVQRRELARRRFVAGRTVVDSEKTRKEKERGGLVGFDVDEKTPDFLGRIEFEMTPAGGIEANDAWTLRVFVVNQGGKPIRVQGVTVGTTVNGTPGAAPVTPSAREIAPQQRVQVAETSGTWQAGTTAWAADATLTAPRNETLRATLTWR